MARPRRRPSVATRGGQPGGLRTGAQRARPGHRSPAALRTRVRWPHLAEGREPHPHRPRRRSPLRRRGRRIGPGTAARRRRAPHRRRPRAARVRAGGQRGPDRGRHRRRSVRDRRRTGPLGDRKSGTRDRRQPPVRWPPQRPALDDRGRLAHRRLCGVHAASSEPHHRDARRDRRRAGRGPHPGTGLARHGDRLRSSPRAPAVRASLRPRGCAVHRCTNT